MSADPAQALRAVQGGDELERRFAADAWQAGELGVPAARGRRAVSFTGISQSWLREGAKRWARQRLFHRLRVQHDLRRSYCVQTLLTFPGRR